MAHSRVELRAGDALLTSPLPRRTRRKLLKPQWRLPQLQWKRIFTALAFFALAACVAYGMILALDQPIRIVSIEGRFQRVSPVQVEQAVTGGLKQGFMSVDLAAVRHRGEEMTWIERERVERRSPNG